ncbi:MAG: DUF4911 domain-containing protein [Geobacter sp.]|nr:DUF4911 domain-containing protein [Geobacter sp.]
MHEITRFIRLKPDDIAYFKFIVESYDGLASLTTIDRKIGVVALCYPASLASEMNSLLSGLSSEIAFAECRPASECDPSSIFRLDMENCRA